MIELIHAARQLRDIDRDIRRDQTRDHQNEAVNVHHEQPESRNPRGNYLEISTRNPMLKSF